MDDALLEYHMKKQGVTIADLCQELGISRSALYRKRTGKSEFTQGEIQKIVDVLNLNSPVPIFFAQ